MKFFPFLSPLVRPQIFTKNAKKNGITAPSSVQRSAPKSNQC